MSVTVTQLEAKLIWLEMQVGETLQQIRQFQFTRSLTPEERENERIERVRAENRRLRPYFDEALKGMISDQEPPSAEEIQQSIIAAGVRPEENLFSRMLIEMRGE